MILCIEMDSATKANLDELVRLGHYKDISEAVSVAVSNQLLLHNHARDAGGSFVVTANDASTASPIKSVSRVERGSEGLSIPAIFSTRRDLPEGLDFAPIPGDAFVANAPVPVDRWIFGQYNKLLPVKASCRALVSMTADNRGISLAKAASEIAAQASELGTYLRNIDKRSGLAREESLAVAFPVTESDTADKARLRYANQFVGTVTKQGQLSGLLADLKLVAMNPGREGRIRLTKAGWEFAMLENPILDTSSISPVKLGESEIEFLIDHINSQVPAENCAYRTILRACAEGANTPEKLDNYLSKKTSPRAGIPFTSAFIATQRSGAISRMSDLGLLARQREGIKVTYVATQRGHEYTNDDVARTA